MDYMKPSIVYESKYEKLKVSVYLTNQEMGVAAAQEAMEILTGVIKDKGQANLILATGNSQLTFLHALRTLPIDWPKINIFHMDEYIGLASTHPASFPRFLKMHFVDHIKPKAFFPIPPSAQDTAQGIAKQYEKLLIDYPADLCALGIGENGHLAFNDPPYADFDDPHLVKIVQLDQASRAQQVGEGHFSKLEDVPTNAITLTIPALMSAKHILALVPEARKSQAVYRSLIKPVSEDCPGSILRQIPYAHLYLDIHSASRILPER
jgi:glucosamine-6-phosphate deaminase